MPEGHTIHRLARALRELFGGERLRVTSPQGRFADGAALLDGRRLVSVEAWGKQLFCGFVPDAGGTAGVRRRGEYLGQPDDAGPGAAALPGRDSSADLPGADHAEVLWLRTHLGLYGAWTFAGAPGAPEVAHAIGAPRKRIGERETIPAAASPAVAASSAAAVPSASAESPAPVVPSAVAVPSASVVQSATVPSPGTDPAATDPATDPVAAAVPRDASAENDMVVDGRVLTDHHVVLDDRWEPPAPRGQVRARLLGRHAVADLTGPAACEVLTSAEKDAVTGRLGPDPIRDGEPGHDADRFVAKAGRSRMTIGQLLMDQAVIAGVGNIYRAEALFRAGVDPLRPGREVAPSAARAIWDDLVVLMRDGARTGAIVTTRPGDRTARHPEDRAAGRRRTRQNTDGSPGAVPADQAFYVYHRDGRPCRVCGGPVLLKDLAARNLFWCGTCQT
ncbi:hypothetical protein GCM10027059_43590 [Myceligenerans halotolerans]